MADIFRIHMTVTTDCAPPECIAFGTIFHIKVAIIHLQDAPV